MSNLCYIYRLFHRVVLIKCRLENRPAVSSYEVM
jgi:hypothetical protein